MPIYQFRADNGDIHEEHFSAAAVPSIGDRIVRDGRTYTRMLSVGRINVQADVAPYRSITIPSGLPGVRTDARGLSVIDGGRAQERQILKELR